MERLAGASAMEAQIIPKLIHTACDFAQHARRASQDAGVRKIRNIAPGPHVTIPHRSMSKVRLVATLRI
jgi:hypothetical protein